ncbi:MAG: hypothetical protein K6E85_10240 [Lachnospiraceae bacterium]|nr:hypothetical protein [Lachnospiraceae bacterium]
MTFCKYCGKQLADGELCDCEGAKKAAEAAGALNEVGEKATDALNEATDVLSETAGKAEETLNAAGSQAADAVTNAGNNVDRAASDFGKNVSELADKAKDVAGDIASKASEAAGAFTSKVGKVAGEVTNSETFKKNKTYIFGGCGLLVLIIVLCAIFIGGGYKKPIDAFVKEVNRGAKTDYVSLISAGMPDDLVKLNKIYYNKIKADWTEDKNDSLKDSFDDLEDEYSKWKIVFDLDKAEKMKKDDLEDFQDKYDSDEDDFEDMLDDLDDIDDLAEDYAEYYDVSEKEAKEYLKAMVKYIKSFKKIKITKGYKVKGRYILKNGSKEINKTDKVTLYVVKMNGNWVIMGSKDSESFRFKSGDDNGYNEVKFLQNYMNMFYPSKMMPGY